MSEKNLNLWDRVSVTSPAFCKKANVGGQSVTSINAIYMVKNATEAFGPIGVNWGYNIIEERVDTGAAVFDGENNILGNTLTHTIKLELWVHKAILDPAWLPDNQNDCGHAKVTHFGHTPYVYWSNKNKYWITDGEAPKKSLTDAIKKCLSLLGFSSDIYMGLYDDFAYVDMLKKQDELDKADDKVLKEIEQRQEWDEWKLTNINLIESSVNLRELEVLYAQCIRKSDREQDKEFKKQVIIATNKRKEHLESKEND